MTYYIPTISRCLINYPFLKKTFRKDYYRFKKIPDTIYNTLTCKAQSLYREIQHKENSQIPVECILAIVCSCIGFILCLLGAILRHLGI
jgi:hypothetical protein